MLFFFLAALKPHAEQLAWLCLARSATLPLLRLGRLSYATILGLSMVLAGLAVSSMAIFVTLEYVVVMTTLMAGFVFCLNRAVEVFRRIGQFPTPLA